MTVFNFFLTFFFFFREGSRQQCQTAFTSGHISARVSDRKDWRVGNQLNFGSISFQMSCKPVMKSNTNTPAPDACAELR